MADPLVTIVIASYNYGEYVGAAVRSALAQSYRNVEVLVLDNASTDDSLAVVRAVSDDRLRVVEQPHNVGIQRNHNDGIRHSTGDYVIFLSADDMLLPTLVGDLLAYRAANRHVDIVYASAAIMNKTGRIIEYFDHPALDGADAFERRNEFANLLTRDNCAYFPATLFPRSVFEELGYLDEELEVLLDYEYDLRMSGAGKLFGFFAKPEA
ncbi:MAG TPA: glycosyltransferase, partial [Verrucomicrobiae bacterium]|nr:glycosyltransferase [Verrucomicrobiae bacterium]